MSSLSKNSLQIIETKDGSRTLLNTELNEHYHSTHGAYQEAMHVFITSGLRYVENVKSEIKILEMGFGTGLNAFLTATHAKKTISYVGIEKYPVPKNILTELDYISIPEIKDHGNLYQTITKVEWDEQTRISDLFSIKKVKTDALVFETKDLFDLVYFDAFAPDYVPHLWTVESFRHFYSLMKTDAVLVTYCAKGQVKRNLRSVGFEVESLDGPPGKREMIRAIKK